MKKVLCLIAIGTMLWSCGGSGGDNPPKPTPVENKAPSVPSLTYPTNELTCIDNSVEFKWSASTDPEGNAITYTIDVSSNTGFSPIAHTFSLSSLTKSISLDKGVIYYYRVKAVDNKSKASAYSPVFNFYTEGVGVTNHVPYSPTLVKPVLDASSPVAVNLEWSANDVDGDVLTYDVYVGTTNLTTELKGDNISATTLNLTLSAATEYYWKVVAKDGKGGEAIGQVWTFKTE